jgi:hypothetical protein
MILENITKYQKQKQLPTPPNRGGIGDDFHFKAALAPCTNRRNKSSQWKRAIPVNWTFRLVNKPQSEKRRNCASNG